MSNMLQEKSNSKDIAALNMANESSTPSGNHTFSESHTHDDSHTPSGSHVRNECNTPDESHTCSKSHINNKSHICIENHTCSDSHINNENHTCSESHTCSETYTCRKNHTYSRSHTCSESHKPRESQIPSGKKFEEDSRITIISNVNRTHNSFRKIPAVQKNNINIGETIIPFSIDLHRQSNTSNIELILTERNVGKMLSNYTRQEKKRKRQRNCLVSYTIFLLLHTVLCLTVLILNNLTIDGVGFCQKIAEETEDQECRISKKVILTISVTLMASIDMLAMTYHICNMLGKCIRNRWIFDFLCLFYSILIFVYIYGTISAVINIIEENVCAYDILVFITFLTFLLQFFVTEWESKDEES
ncbi:leucine-rich repeat and coiled-coil domain-containing protein PF3D7_0703800-like [Hydractinia symbiolongicarpus]|uniref:leucine-rich repeat and coiled-coil domain-containing protein PF3D7_0703800-like n=1 Tax=Hydractinia symbiolongicarpus TaxID=13093 RepID=UPI00254A0318|nr:leucine-rich repeat and coiled-coil domain-containing protein PF3D7_0703800-like [Hydractinia symbiolongicarpus]